MTNLPSIDDLSSETRLKLLAAELRRSPELRARWGQNVTVWENVVRVLETYTETSRMPVSLLQFLNNLTASNGIGGPALSVGFLETFSRVATGTDTIERRLYWQILANFISSFAEKGSNDLEQAIVHTSPDLPFEDAITSASEAVAYPCLVFLSTANKLITSLPAKLKLNISSGALGSLLDVLPLWFSGGEEKDQCIKCAKNIFEYCVTSGAFADLLATYQYNSSRELTLLSMFDAVISSSGFLVSENGGLQYIDTEIGKNDVAAISSRAEISIEDAIKLISKPDRTVDESFLVDQRLLKLLDILITLLSPLPTQKRQTQRHLIPDLVKLLVELKKIPPISKLGSAKSFEELPLDDRSFPHLKTYLLMLLAVLVENDFESQELIRECGGLAAVLECCVIDGNNPFMKERAIVCLRYVLKGNDANQTFVASLEARQVADPEALAEAGYEASFENGKLSLKARST